MLDFTKLFGPDIIGTGYSIFLALMALGYTFFAFLLVSQISNMIRSFTSSAATFFRMMSYAHFAASVGVLLLALTLFI